MRRLPLLLSLLWPVPLTPAAPQATPPDATSHILFGQAFDSHIADLSVLSGTRAYVWSDNKTVAGSAIPGVIVGHYTEAYRAEGYSGGGYYDQPGFTEWFYEHHPDWIAYREDARTIAYEFGDPRFTPLDIANPEVIAFKEAEVRARLTHHTWVDVDNFDLENSFHVAGHYRGATAPCPPSNRPACGGRWVAQYSGRPLDRAWIADNDAYLTALVARFHATGQHVMINNAQDGPPRVIRPHDWLTLAREADGALLEGFPLNSCTTADDLVRGVPVGAVFDAQYEDAVGLTDKAFFADAYLCNSDVDTIAPDRAAWVTAVFLLVSVNPSMDYLALGPERTTPYRAYPPTLSPPIGHATEPPPPVGSRPYVRAFTNGFVAVNPDRDLSYSVNIPAGDYRDQFGTPLPSGHYTLVPMSGLVVVGPQPAGGA